MSELDKKLKSNKNFLVRFRGWFQAAATLLTNLHIPNLFKGKIYQGKVKTICVPGLNCYSCPAATDACPIGAFQAVVGSSKFKFTYYITGFFILLGVLLGDVYKRQSQDCYSDTVPLHQVFLVLSSLFFVFAALLALAKENCYIQHL